MDNPELEEKLSELEILRQSLEESKTKEKDTYDQLLRLGAEFQNFRKRSETRITESRKAGREEILLEMMRFLDGLLQAELATQNATDITNVKKGVTMVRQQFEKFLTDAGLTPIETKGEKLDPHRHEAIARVFDSGKEEGVIVDEIQRGYTLNGQVIRPARVRVAAKAPETAEPSAQQEEK